MVSCDDYDYLEIASLYQLSVTLQTSSGDILSGQIVDLFVSPDKREWLTLRLSGEDSEDPRVGKKVQIETKTLVAMIANTTNPHFSRIDFVNS